MQDSGIPAKFPIPFANSAGSGFIRPIPQASQIGIQNGAASLTDGFPPNCFAPIAGGGSWPFGQDFNGLLKQITQWLQWMQAGGPIQWDSTFSAAIGGYPNGAVVASATTAGLWWRSAVDNNTTNPDTGGAGWVNAYAGRLLNIQTITSTGTYAPTAGTNSIVMDLQAAGGAGGGSPATDGTHVAAAGGGGAGARAISRILSGFSGVTITLGAAGSGSSGGDGGSASASTFGGLVSVPGGNGGTAGTATNATFGSGGGAATAAPSGGNIFQNSGGAGGWAQSAASAGICIGGSGAGSAYGDGGAQTGGTSAGLAANGYGAGGGGAATNLSGTAQVGGNGAPAICIIYEYS